MCDGTHPAVEREDVLTLAAAAGEPGGHTGVCLREAAHEKSRDGDEFTEPLSVQENFVFLSADFSLRLYKLSKS